MEYKINVRNHWWFDAGIVGLYFIGNKVKKNHSNISLSFVADCLIIEGENEEEIRMFLEQCYSFLALMYWNTSTKEQIARNELVLYNKETKEFSVAPKRQATPVVSSFVKGTSWKANGAEYEKLDDILKSRTDEYLKETGKSLWGNKKKLLFTLPECQPDIKILPRENNNRQSACSVCGKLTSNLTQISQPSFLLFASKNAAQSFHTQGKKPAKICWECELLSKFTMDTINYKKDGTSLSILLLNSQNLKDNIDNQSKIGSNSVLRGLDSDYFYKNIGFDPDGLIGKAKMSYELLWSYFVDTYAVLKSNEAITDFLEEDLFLRLLGDIVSSPMEIIVINLDGKGQTFLTKELIFYNDVSYVYRLLSHLISINVDVKSVYNSLYETDSKGNLMPSRNSVLKKVLNKYCIVSDVEAITFRKVYENKPIKVSNVINFLKEYYLMIKEDIMNREQIEVAVNLGKQIVYQPYMASGEDKEVLKKIKGDLFALRKTRTVTDFVTQLNTLQFRYGISVSKSILDGILNEVSFEDFKGYCIMGALNNFNYYNSSKKQKGDSKDE
ncbi:hypothetical protein [Tissierella sp.]|uniref:hypothetical protein n=1 Tax=Tissierella sp. TaxID=41274 RepID=UPI003057AE79